MSTFEKILVVNFSEIDKWLQFHYLAGVGQRVQEERDAGRPRARAEAPPNMAHIRQSRPDSGVDFQAKVVKTF